MTKSLDKCDGLTPSGGSRSEAVFLDGEGKAVKRAEATKIVIREFDERGNLIAETFGSVEKS